MSLLVNHPSYQKSVKLLETTVGREKLMRLVQYWSQFLSFVLYRQGYSKTTYLFWKKLQVQLGLARKLFRAGMPLSLIQNAVAAAHNQTEDPVLRFTTIGRQLGLAGFLSLDSLMWLNNSNVYKFNNVGANKIQRLSMQFWLASLAFSVANWAYKYNRTAKAQQALLSESEKDAASLKKVAYEKYDASLHLVWDLADTTIPLSALGYVGLDDGIVGLAGLFTSILALKGLWK